MRPPGLPCLQVLLARQARSAVAGMGPSDVAVMTREDARIGLPRFERVARGLDFGRAFGGLASGVLPGGERALRNALVCMR